MNNFSNFRSVYGWPAKVKRIVDESKNDEETGSRLAVEMRLMPDWKVDEVWLDGLQFGLDVLMRIYKKDLSLLFYRNVKKNQHIIVMGDLSQKAFSEAEFKNIDTSFWLDEFLLDNSGGKISPVVGHLYTSSGDEYFATAESRFDKACPSCGLETSVVPEEYTRYCPKCEAPADEPLSQSA